nr:hypothetical protein [uncultured Peptostreptococcus sp.]
MYNKKLLKFDEESDNVKDLIEDFDEIIEDDFGLDLNEDAKQDSDENGIKIVLPDGIELVDDLDDDFGFEQVSWQNNKDSDISRSLSRIADALEKIAKSLEK